MICSFSFIHLSKVGTAHRNVKKCEKIMVKYLNMKESKLLKSACTLYIYRDQELILVQML